MRKQSNLNEKRFSPRKILQGNYPFIASSFVFICSLTINLVYFFQTCFTPIITIPILDAKYYLDWAKSIANGTPTISGAFFVEPGYAYFLSFFIKVFPAIPNTPLLVQSLLGSLSLVFIFLTLRHFYPRSYAPLLTTFLLVFLAPLIFYNNLYLKTSLEIFLISTSTFLLAKTWESKKIFSWILLGILFGLTALTKSNILYTTPFLAITYVFSFSKTTRKDSFWPLLAFFASLFLMISPASIHNWRANGGFVPINYSGGPNLYLGNWSESDGAMKPPEYISLDPRFEERDWNNATTAFVGQPVKASRVNAFWTRQTLKEISLNPKHFATLTLSKTLLYFQSKIIDDNFAIAYVISFTPWLHYFYGYWLVLIFSTVGIILVFWRKERRLYPFASIILAYTGTIIASHITERYRIALLPLTAIFCATSFVWLGEQISKRKFAKIIFFIITIFGFSLFAKYPFSQVTTVSIADMENNFGYAELQNQNLPSAREHFKKSLTLNKYTNVYNFMAILALEEKKFNESLSFSRAFIGLWPDAETYVLRLAYQASNQEISPEEIRNTLTQIEKSAEIAPQMDPLAEEGFALIKPGKFQEAETIFEKLYQEYPENDKIITNLARLYQENKKPKAEEIFLKAIEMNSFNLIARYNLGIFYADNNQHLKAIEQYKKVLEYVPGYQLTRFYLAQSLLATNQKTELTEQLKIFVQESEFNADYSQEIKIANDFIKENSVPASN